MKKVKRTPEEEAEHKERVAHNRRYAGFKRTLRTRLDELGLRQIELQLEYLEDTPTTPLPKKTLSHADTVNAYKEVIEDFNQAISNNFSNEHRTNNTP